MYKGRFAAGTKPWLTGLTRGHDPTDSLPFASSLCGACYEVCPVKIDLPSMLVQLRREHVAARAAQPGLPSPEAMAMKAASWTMSDSGRWARLGWLTRLGRPFLRRGRPVVPVPGIERWTAARDLPTPPTETFREWWARERGGDGS